MFTIDTEVRLLAKSEEVWPFFSNARNLERLTPGFLKFQVLTPDPIEMKEGTLIDDCVSVASRFVGKAV